MKTADLRQLYADALAGHGYHVDAAEDGAAGWQALQANRYILITEHELPDLTGVELVKRLRAAPHGPAVVMCRRKIAHVRTGPKPVAWTRGHAVKTFALMLAEHGGNVLRVTDTPREQIEPLPVWQSQPSADGLPLR